MLSPVSARRSRSATSVLLRTAAIATAFSLVLASRAAAAPIVLYDGTLGGLPSDQGMAYGNLPIGTVTPTAGGGVTNLNTSLANLLQAGFLALSPFTLDPAIGYSLQFTAELLSESHTGNALRAGFSVLLIGANPSQGIEIGFQDGRVFAQNDNPLFGDPPADVNALYNPVGAGVVNFDLSVFGTAYTLLASGVPVLSGSLRDYSASGFPYTVSNFVFLGDDTTSAKANVNLARVALVLSDPAAAPVPEPSTLATLLIGVAGLGFVRLRRA